MNENIPENNQVKNSMQQLEDIVSIGALELNKTVTLAQPIKVNGIEVNELVVNCLTVGDRITLSQSNNLIDENFLDLLTKNPTKVVKILSQVVTANGPKGTGLSLIGDNKWYTDLLDADLKKLVFAFLLLTNQLEAKTLTE